MKYLFVCIQNAGRSQMAAIFASAIGLTARSAGSNPAESVHPQVIEVMHEIGIDIAQNIPNKLTLEDAHWADVIVTMGCGDECPYIPDKTYIDWKLSDPHGKDLDAVRNIRDQIHELVQDLHREVTEKSN